MEINDYPLTKKMEKAKEELVEKLLENQIILTWLKNNQAETSIVKENSQMFARYLSALDSCRSCQSLSSCRFLPKGYLQVLDYDGGLYIRLKACKYNEENDRGYRDNFIYYDQPESNLLLNFNNIQQDNEGSLKSVLIRINKQLTSGDYRGVFLYGDLGVGKTLLLNCVANYYAKSGKRVFFANMGRLSQQARTLISDPGSLADLFDDMKNCDVLLLDDVGNNKMSEWLRDDLLNMVLDYRMENKYTTWMTSNKDYELLREYFKINDQDETMALRLMERIEALTIPLKLEGKNMRREVVK